MFFDKVVTFEFQLSVRAAARIVKRWTLVCDHLTEMPPFCWVIAAFQCDKLFDCCRLAVALHYTEFQAILSPPSWNFNDATCVIPLPYDGRPWTHWEIEVFLAKRCFLCQCRWAALGEERACSWPCRAAGRQWPATHVQGCRQTTAICALDEERTSTQRALRRWTSKTFCSAL